MKKLKWAGPALAALLSAACGDGYDETRETAESGAAEGVTNETAGAGEAGTDEIGQADTDAEQRLTVAVRDSNEYGRYLADGNGRPLYMFTADTAATGADGDARFACTGECLDAWPPAVTTGEPEAGAGVDDTLLGTTTHDDGLVATYAGWPLYYFARDGGGAAEPKGQEIVSFGGEWYLVTPDGMKVGAREE